MAIFEQTSGIASMFSGYLQAALYKGLGGRHGLAGWQWLFIFDGYDPRSSLYSHVN